jgi:hypothetical protein
MKKLWSFEDELGSLPPFHVVVAGRCTVAPWCTTDWTGDSKVVFEENLLKDNFLQNYKKKY